MKSIFCILIAVLVFTTAHASIDFQKYIVGGRSTLQGIQRGITQYNDYLLPDRCLDESRINEIVKFVKIFETAAFLSKPLSYYRKLVSFAVHVYTQCDVETTVQAFIKYCNNDKKACLPSTFIKNTTERVKDINDFMNIISATFHNDAELAGFYIGQLASGILLDGSPLDTKTSMKNLLAGFLVPY